MIPLPLERPVGGSCTAIVCTSRMVLSDRGCARARGLRRGRSGRHSPRHHVNDHWVVGAEDLLQSRRIRMN